MAFPAIILPTADLYDDGRVSGAADMAYAYYGGKDFIMAFAVNDTWPRPLRIHQVTNSSFTLLWCTICGIWSCCC
jgi:hypothetical protein